MKDYRRQGGPISQQGVERTISGKKRGVVEELGPIKDVNLNLSLKSVGCAQKSLEDVWLLNKSNSQKA